MALLSVDTASCHTGSCFALDDRKNVMPINPTEQHRINSLKQAEDELYWGTWACWYFNGLCDCGKNHKKDICEKWKQFGEALNYKLTHKMLIPFALASFFCVDLDLIWENI